MKRYKYAVSVLMPCYNAGKFIKQAIESILNQTLTDFELIIIDDCSTDDTVSIINGIKHERIKLFKLKENLGNYIARNIGIRNAQGKYLCSLDADDEASPDRLMIQANYLESHPGIGIVASNYEVVDNQGNHLAYRIRPFEHYRIKVSLLANNYLLHSSLMVRSRLIKKNGLYYNENYRYSSDYDFLVRFTGKFKVVCLQHFLVQYRIHDNQISKEKEQKQRMIADKIRINQFLNLGMTGNEADFELLNTFMKNRPISSEELDKLMFMLNTMISLNKQQKIYNQNYLKKFLQLRLNDTLVY